MDEWINKCIVCERILEDIMPGADHRNRSSCIEGGTFEIDFGYGSRFDDMNFDDVIRHQACICDDCYEKKQHLTRPVRINQCTTRVNLPRDYRSQTENNNG